MSAKEIIPVCMDCLGTKNNEKKSLCSDKKDQEKEEKEEEEDVIDQEWWDRNWVWRYRSPYVTGELMDKLEPYIKKLETTPAWRAYDQYFRSIGPLTEDLSLETRWKIASQWHEREDPKAFWDKVKKDEQKNRALKNARSKDWRRKYQDSVSYNYE